MKPVMIVLAGPNGAGKSTLYHTRIAPIFAGPFINADLIQRDELKDGALDASYEAACIATERRAAFIANKRDFVTETVFSHPSKLALVDDARAAGFTCVMMHVGVETPELSVARVKARVEEQGHAVPEDKVRARFERCGALIRQAVLKADRGFVYDNSALNTPPKRGLEFKRGARMAVRPTLPGWIRSLYAAELVL